MTRLVSFEVCTSTRFNRTFIVEVESAQRHLQGRQPCPPSRKAGQAPGQTRLICGRRHANLLFGQVFPEQRRKEESLKHTKDDMAVDKLQAPVYDILPSTTAVFSYAIVSIKLSATEQFFAGA